MKFLSNYFNSPKNWLETPLPAPPAIPASKHPQIFPWSNAKTAFLVLTVIAPIAVFFTPDSVSFWVAIGFTALIGAVFAYWLQKGFRATLNVLPELTPRLTYSAAQDPRLNSYFLRLGVIAIASMMSVIFALAFGVTGQEVDWLISGMIALFVFAVWGQMFLLSHLSLQRDSVESSNQRDAAAISFTIIAAAAIAGAFASRYNVNGVVPVGWLIVATIGLTYMVPLAILKKVRS